MSFEQSIIRVYNGNPTQGGSFAGTAFFIKPQCLLSANHVFKLDCPNGAFLQLPAGEVWQVPPSAIEHCKTTYGERDIALIHLPRAFNAYCPPLALHNPQSGHAVTLYGFFDAVQSVHQRQTHISGYVGVQHAFNLSGSIPRGMSGGAVLFEGQLMGLIYARDADKNIAYCIPIDEIRACLGEMPLDAPDELPVYERLGDVRNIAITQGKIADILEARGQLDEALRIRQTDQLPVFERLGDVRSVAITQGKIARICFQQHKQAEAIDIYEREVLPIYVALGDKRMLLVDQANLAMMYLQTGENVARAKSLLHSALQAAQDMRIPEVEQIQAILEQLA